MFLTAYMFFHLDFCAAVLSDRKGAAFVPSPAQGKLGPFEQIVVEVTAYMDMWGEYSDVLSCMVCIQGRGEGLWALGQSERLLARHTSSFKLSYHLWAPIAMGPRVSDLSDLPILSIVCTSELNLQ